MRKITRHKRASRIVGGFVAILIPLGVWQGAFSCAHAQNVADDGCPSISSVELEPSSPVTGDKLKAVPKGEAEQSDLARIQYLWKVNGRELQNGDQSALSYHLHRGDFIEVEATTCFSPLRVLSNSVKVGNAPPTPRLVQSGVNGDGVYTAKIEAVDPESDAVTFSLKSGPPGMQISPSDGTITWQPQADANGSYGVEATAKDAEGAESTIAFQIKLRWESTGKEKESNATATTSNK